MPLPSATTTVGTKVAGGGKTTQDEWTAVWKASPVHHVDSFVFYLFPEQNSYILEQNKKSSWEESLLMICKTMILSELMKTIYRHKSLLIIKKPHKNDLLASYQENTALFQCLIAKGDDN